MTNPHMQEQRAYKRRKALNSDAYHLVDQKFTAAKRGDSFSTKELREEFGLTSGDLGFILTALKHNGLIDNPNRGTWIKR